MSASKDGGATSAPPPAPRLKLNVSRSSSFVADAAAAQARAAPSASSRSFATPGGEAPPRKVKLKISLSQPPTPAVERPAVPLTKTKAGRQPRPTQKLVESKKRTHDDDENLPLAVTAGGPPTKIKIRQGLKAAPTQVVLKPRGRPPLHPPGDGYDSEASDREVDPAIEEQFILRMFPGEHCDYVRWCMENGKMGLPRGQGGADIVLKFFEEETRRAMVTVKGQPLAAVMVDLPTITESMKTWDKKSLMKSADICQMLLVFQKVRDENEAKLAPLPPMIDSNFKWPHGLTPPMHDCVNRRFAKTISRKEIEDKEAEVERLLAEDAKAISTKWEWVDERQQDAEDEYGADEDAEGEVDDGMGYFGAQGGHNDVDDNDLEADLEAAFADEITVETPATGMDMMPMATQAETPAAALQDSIENDEESEEDDDDDDDDDELYEDNDMKANPNIIDNIAPNFTGFQQHVATLNPGLGATHGYLVDRIAHQQVIRYKHLLNAKVKHLGLGASCTCGSLCIALGGSANILDQKGDSRGVDPVPSQLNGPDEGTPTEGVINQESFPQDIPMPPTQYLPAEFECQLCYQRKKFQKPSDWTKHVHEDVQPFTCTWDKCRDPKIFKRKADWVRHENEGHRHLEWWTCDVDDCRHTCYRRDNFLQHLVREHKFLEPKVKTKAAMKRAGGMDPTWQMVEQCHIETSTRPHEEPCRFCGKAFPTWKKLTVHLAKHMEQISLPVLRLVAAKAKELAADTIISPVQDPPPQPMIPLPNQTAPAVQYPGVAQQQRHQFQPGHQHMGYPNQSHFLYPVMPPGQYQQQHQQQTFYAPQYDNIGQSLQQPALGVGRMNQGYGLNQQIPGLSNTPDAFVPTPNPYMPMNDNDVEPFPELNALGLQNVGDGQMGGQMGYDAMMDPSSVNGSPFSGHESLSTYSHSPHQNASSNKNQEQTWEERRLTGFL